MTSLRTRRLQDVTFTSDLLTHLRGVVSRVERVQWPSPRYRSDPVGFARDILGIELWDRQVDIAMSVVAHDQVAVRGAQKVGKSNTAAVLALWWYCSHEDARVMLSATTEMQVNRVLYRELRRLIARSGRCVDCRTAHDAALAQGLHAHELAARCPCPCPHSQVVDGTLGATAESGLTCGLRQVVGIVARSQESVAGISGANQLWICDEASGMSAEFLAAATGNLAGGGKIVMISNPTRVTGYFFDAFHRSSAAWHTLHVSAPDSPNVVQGRLVVPGLASRSWIETKKREHGETSAYYRVRVLGEFPVGESGLIFPLSTISLAEHRWHDVDAGSVEGRLWIGLDPAGAAGDGDESVFCLRRGKYIVELLAYRGLTDDAHLEHLLGIIERRSRKRDPLPVVVIDAEGKIGAGLAGRLASHLREKKDYSLVRVRASEKALREPKVYYRVRDELVANLEAAFADGLAIPEDAKLTEELHLYAWDQRPDGRYTLTPDKERIRRELMRSPDRLDALALSCWEPLDIIDGIGAATASIRARSAGTTLDAMAAIEAARRIDDPFRGGYRRR
jgi:phage terminase large subunit